MALDGVTSFLRLKDVANTCKCMRRGLSIGGSSSVQRHRYHTEFLDADIFRLVFSRGINILKLKVGALI